MSGKTLLTRAELAAMVGLSVRQISALAQAPDCPRRSVKGEMRFDAPRFVRWYAERRFEQGRRVAKPVSLDEARARKAAAEAEMAEYELALKRRELMTVEEGQKVLVDAFGRVRAQLLAVPGRAAPDLLGVATLPEMHARLVQVMADVMKELAAAKDVPAPEADEAVEDDVDSPAA